MKTTPYFTNKLKEELSHRQSKTRSYSLRAYARDLKMHPATLSQVLHGKRALPFKNALEVVQKLNLTPKEKTLFMDSLLKIKIQLDDITISEDNRFMLDESHHKVIAEWEHYAVIELFNLSGFVCNKNSIAHYLDISELRAEVVLHNLMQAGLIAFNQEAQLYSPIHGELKTTADIKSQALRESHRETLEMGKNKLDQIEVELREFSSTTVALDLKKLPEAKAIIREFHLKMDALLRDGDKTDVYQLAIQFYPLTNIKKTKLKENL